MLSIALVLAWAIMAAVLLTGRLTSRITERVNDYYLRLSMPAALLCLAAGLVYLRLLLFLHPYSKGLFKIDLALLKDCKWGTLAAALLIFGSLAESLLRRFLIGRHQRRAAPLIAEEKPKICSWGLVRNYRVRSCARKRPHSMPGCHDTLDSMLETAPAIDSAGAFKGTILHISDLHYGRPSRETLKKVIAEANSLQPDYIAVTGDFIQLGADPLELKELLTPLKARRAIFYVLGNHDFWTRLDSQVAEILDGLKWIHLNEKAYADGNVLFLGSEAPWGPNKPVLEEVSDKGAFPVALSHDPDEWPRFLALGIPVTLSGHTHGGQIRLGFFGPIIIPSKNGALYGERLLSSRGKDGQTSVMLISRGLGKPYFRLCNPLEISLISFGK